MNIQHLKMRFFCTETNPMTNQPIILAAVSMSAVTKTCVGTGTTLVTEQAASYAKKTKNKPLDKRSEICRSPALLDHSLCKYQKPYPLRIL